MTSGPGDVDLPCGLVWTGVDFSACVVAPPGERSVGADRWEAARRGVEMSVEGAGGNIESPLAAYIAPLQVGIERMGLEGKTSRLPDYAAPTG